MSIYSWEEILQRSRDLNSILLNRKGLTTRLNFILATVIILLMGCLPCCVRIRNNYEEKHILVKSIKVLTLNMKASDSRHTREERVQPVVELVKSESIDVLFLQEGTSGLVPGNSIGMLQTLLGNYDCFMRPSFGYWMFFQYEIGLLSRFKFYKVDSAPCRIKSKEFVDNLFIPGRRRAIAGLSDVPGMGRVAFVSVHLDSSPVDETERMRQYEMLLEFLQRLSTDIIILAGDFNAGLTNPGFKMLQDYGFEIVGSSIVDHILVKGGRGIRSEVVFTDNYVSDHCGVFAEITPYPK
ncbi:MAG: endonuclease/exonuclease/phosphatase family protein [Candidatus Omnitrophica bacterium]|nr:endonuclease/exonuclease/phosphatase family protein [Candidatus Omnitrophota bacterium]